MYLNNIKDLISIDNNAQFIDACYQVMLGRIPDLEGMRYYSNLLAQGDSKEDVIFSIFKSKESKVFGPKIQDLDMMIKKYKKQRFFSFFFPHRGLEKQVRLLGNKLEGIHSLLEQALKQGNVFDSLSEKAVESETLNPDDLCLTPVSEPQLFLKAEIREHISFVKSLPYAFKLSVVIPSYEDSEVLDLCVKSIQTHGNGYISEIVISDDASPSKEHFKYLNKLQESEHSIPVRVLFSEVNCGFSANVNRGLRSVEDNADVLLLNSDTELTKGSVEALISVARRNGSLTGARLLYPNKEIQHGGGFRNFNSLEWFEHLYRGRDRLHTPSLVSKNTLFCTGAALYIPNEVRARVGLFDEGFQMGFEDVDYCLRAWQNNIPVIYCGASEIIHHESITRGKVQGEREISSQKFFWKKHDTHFNSRRVLGDDGRIQIVFVLKDTGIGGGHRVIFNFANYLVSQNMKVDVWSLAKKPDWYKVDSRVVFKTFESFKELEADLTPINAIKIATWWETADSVWNASLFNGVPVWLSQDIETSYYAKRDTYNEMRAYASYRPEFVYLVNYKWIKAVLEVDFRYHSNYIGLGIDKDKFFLNRQKKNKKQFRVNKSMLVCARGEPIKGFSYTKEIIRELMADGYKITAYGSDKSLIDDLPGITFVHKPNDETLRQLFNESQYFLQTSIHEGLSLPPLEAMNCGCIPVVTDAYGNRDYIKDGYNCVIIDRNLDNAVNKIRALDWAICSKELAVGIKNTVSEYDWSGCYSRLKSIIHAIAAEPIYGKTKYDTFKL